MNEIFLVRHGQTDWNLARRFQGHTDIALNATVIGQAGHLARRLQCEEFDAVYSSDLRRAVETARPTAMARHLEVGTEPDLRERCYGIFEGLTIAERAERFPQEHARWASHDPTYVIPGGESQEAFRARIFACLERLTRRHEGRAILVVTHGGSLDMVHRLAMATPWNVPRSCPVPNAAVNRIRWSGPGQRPTVISWADARHLQAPLVPESDA